jgi:predicted nucleic acid-binding protein
VIVVDASVVLKWILPEPDREEAVLLLDEYESGKINLIAPPVIVLEVASDLSKRCRRKLITGRQAEQTFQNFEIRQPVLIDNGVQSGLSLSIQHQLSLWDCLYLALAIDRRADLVTADRRFRAAANRHYPFVRPLSQTLF